MLEVVEDHIWKDGVTGEEGKKAEKGPKSEIDSLLQRDFQLNIVRTRSSNTQILADQERNIEERHRRDA